MHLRTSLCAVLVAVLLCGCGKKTSQPVAADYSTSPRVTVRLGKKNGDDGLRQILVPTDGYSTFKMVEDVECQWIARTNQDARYFYFLIDPSFKRNCGDRVRVEIEYFDALKGSFDLQYDGAEKTYTTSERLYIQEGTRKWATAEFHLHSPRFDNAENGNADFRLRFRTPEFFLRRVTVHGAGPQVGLYSYAPAIAITLGKTNDEQGLQLTYEYSSGATAPAFIQGIPCRKLTSRTATQMAFVIDNSFKKTNHMDARLTIEYFDEGCSGILDLQYDGWSSPEPPCTHSPTRVTLNSPGKWAVAEFEMPNARFENHEHGEADFRIRVQQPKLYVRRVTLRRISRE